jgi:hypothetical protein
VVVGRGIGSAMFGFFKRPPGLEELVGDEFLLDFGGQALRGRGSVRVVCTDLGFELRIGPATLHTLDGAPWSAHPFSIEAGSDVHFEGRKFTATAGAFNVLELPDQVWFGPTLELTEDPNGTGCRVLRDETVQLGLTRERRFRKSLQEVRWVQPELASWQPSESLCPPEVAHRSWLPAEHSAVYVAPELYAFLRKEDDSPRFDFAREDYDESLRRWTSAAVPVWDEEFPPRADTTLRRLESPCATYASSLLLLSWLGAELQSRCRGEPILQLVGRRLCPRLCWLDSEGLPWQERLRTEVDRLTAKSWGTPWGPPLRYESGAWVAAGEPLSGG